MLRFFSCRCVRASQTQFSTWSGMDLLKLENELTSNGVDSSSTFEILYGIHPVNCALSAKRRTIQTVYYRKDLLETNDKIKQIIQHCWEENIETQAVHRSKIDALLLPQSRSSNGKPPHHQGLLAKVSRLYFTPTPCTSQFVEDVCQSNAKSSSSSPSSKQVWLLLNEIQDPMNFGSILRSAYFLGCENIFVSSQKNCSLTPVVSKASSGAMELVSVHSVNNILKFCEILKELKWDIVVTSAQQQQQASSLVKHEAEQSHSCSINSFQLENSSLIILGNEGRGLPQQLMDACTRQVYIESRPNLHVSVDSMNVSAAAAVILHRLLSVHRAQS